MRMLRPALSLTLSLATLPLDAARALAASATFTPGQIVAVAQPVASAALAGPVPIAGAPAPGVLGAAPVLTLAPALVVAPAFKARAGSTARPERVSLAQAGDLARAPQRAARAYDGGRDQGSSSLFAAGVAAAPAAPWVAGAAAPLLYAAHAYAKEKRETPAEAPPKLAMTDVLEAGGVWVVTTMLSGMAFGLLRDTMIFGPVLGLLWAVGSIGMRQAMETTRSKIVGGWQASHDQRYRVGIDGQLKDVRGHKYGEDRYDRYAPGPTRPGERLALRLISAGTGLALAVTAGPVAAAVYGVSWTLASAAYDAYRRRHAQPAGPVDDEERAYASRFQK